MCHRSVVKLLVFSETWNAIVEELHIVDLLSKTELSNLVFQLLPIDDSTEVSENGVAIRPRPE